MRALILSFFKIGTRKTESVKKHGVLTQKLFKIGTKADYWVGMRAGGGARALRRKWLVRNGTESGFATAQRGAASETCDIHLAPETNCPNQQEPDAYAQEPSLTAKSCWDSNAMR